jgi:NTE family protein
MATAEGTKAMLWDGIARRAFGLDGGGGEGSVSQIVADREPRARLKVGIALGSGAARGWSHIGVMRVLEREGIVPDVIAGSSVGAVVGACFAAGKLDVIEEFALSLTKRRVMGLLDFHITGSGLIAGDRLRRLLEHDLADLRIESLPIRFATIATELGTGHEIWITRGPLVEALRASYALPGVFDPVRLGGRWLMDGAIVNPIPVTTARALGADLVVCVNLNGDIRIRGTVIQSHSAEMEEGDEIIEAATEERGRWSLLNPVIDAAGRVRGLGRRAPGPGIASVMVDAFNITQDRIARSRLAGDPPDVMIAPKLSPIGLFEFHRAEECIDLGRQAAERALPDLFELMRDTARVG